MSRINFPIRRLATTQRRGGVYLLRPTSTGEGWRNVALESLACGTLVGAVEFLKASQADRVGEYAVQFDGSAISKGKWDDLTRVMREPSDQLAGSVASLHSTR